MTELLWLIPTLSLVLIIVLFIPRRHITSSTPRDTAGTPFTELACCCNKPLSEWDSMGKSPMTCRICGKVSPFRMHYLFRHTKAMGHFSADAYRWENQSQEQRNDHD